MTRIRYDIAAAIDITRFCERQAERLRSNGATHPVAAAVALAARGHRGDDVDAFAADIGVDVVVLRAIEAGDVAFGELPDALAIAFACIPSASLFLLADLDREMNERE